MQTSWYVRLHKSVPRCAFGRRYRIHSFEQLLIEFFADVLQVVYALVSGLVSVLYSLLNDRT